MTKIVRQPAFGKTSSGFVLPNPLRARTPALRGRPGPCRFVDCHLPRPRSRSWLSGFPQPQPALGALFAPFYPFCSSSAQVSLKVVARVAGAACFPINAQVGQPLELLAGLRPGIAQVRCWALEESFSGGRIVDRISPLLINLVSWRNIPCFINMLELSKPTE